jgi:hypothetical protein
MRAGEVIGITGRPGNGKSSLQSYIALQEANQIITRGTLDSEIVLYVTWEQSVEVQELFFQSALAGDYEYTISDLAWLRADRQKVIDKAINGRVHNPIWVAGASIMDATNNAPMFVEHLFSEIQRIKSDHGVKPTLICFDYLQRIPVRAAEQRNLQVAEAIINTSYLAKSVAAAALLGVQAKDKVDDRNSKIPTMADTYYSSELAHVVDKHFGIMKPSKYFEMGSMFAFDIGGQKHHIKVDDHVLLLQLDKQRLEQGMQKFAVRFDMNRMTISDYDFHTQKFDWNEDKSESKRNENENYY